MSNKSEILRLHNLFQNKDELTKYYMNLEDQRIFNQKNYRSIITNPNFSLHDYDPDDLLCNIPYSLKDNIATTLIKSTGGSLLLQNYTPLFDATVYENLKKTKAVLIAKDALDEFGLGGTGTYCAFGSIINPFDATFITAGSSSGSAVNVATNLCPFSICTDTGDSIRRPASFLGNLGFKPSYGLISRYGVYSYSPSLDTVGIMCKYVTDAAIVLSHIASHDKKDFTNVKQNTYDFYSHLTPANLKQVKFAYLSNGEDFMHEDAKAAWKEYLNYLKQHLQITPIKFDEQLLRSLIPTYIAISYAEATTSLANLTGWTFGEKDMGSDYKQTIIQTRTKYLGEQLKKRFILGSYVLTIEHYNEIFVKAKKIRRLIQQTINQLFETYDCILIPGSGSFATKKSELSVDGNLCDDLLLLANFCGLPSLTLPAIKQEPSFLGVNLNTKNFEDQKLLNIALAIEQLNEQYKNGEKK